MRHVCEDILEQTKDSGVPLGVSVESVSIFKNEVEAAHELFRRCQHIALDFFKRPWRVNVELIDDKNRKTNNNAEKKTNSTKTEGGVLGENSTWHQPVDHNSSHRRRLTRRSFGKTLIKRERERERERSTTTITRPSPLHNSGKRRQARDHDG